MARIFISYSRQDEDFARRLAHTLSEMGADIWIDVEDIPAGMKWSSAIQQGLDSAQLMLVVISPPSMASNNVEDEWQYYLDHKKPVIPLLLQPAKIHFQLSRIQYVDFHGQKYDVAINQLHAELQRNGLYLDLPPLPDDAESDDTVPITNPRSGHPPHPVENVPPPLAAPGDVRVNKQISTQSGGGQRVSKQINTGFDLRLPLIGVGVAALLVIAFVVVLVLSNGNGDEGVDSAAISSPTVEIDSNTGGDLPTNTVTATNAPTQTENATSTATITASPTATASPTSTATATASSTATITPVPLGLNADNRVTRNDDWQEVGAMFNDVEMVLVPAGCFMMGSSEAEISAAVTLCRTVLEANSCGGLFNDEAPQTDLCFDTPFWIDRTEVSNAAYGGDETPNHPVRFVNWADAREHCAERGARLPTEAEWEYAARGPDNLIYPWGNTFDGSLVNFCDGDCPDAQAGWRDNEWRDGYGTTAPVDSLTGGASWVGALHMAGDLWEYTSTIYGFDYPYDANDGREDDTNTTSQRTLRGSQWGWIAAETRAAARAEPLNGYARSEWYGFRCVRDFSPGDLGE